MSIPKVFAAEKAYKKSLSLLNLDKDDDSLEGKEYAIKTKTTQKGTAKNDEFTLMPAALTSSGILSLDGGKGQDELSFDSASVRKIVFNEKSQIKSLSIEQDSAMQEVQNASFAGFEKYDFGGNGKVTLSATAGRTISKGTLMDIETGNGKDNIVFGGITIRGGSGTDAVTGLEIGTGSGKDKITLGDVTIKSNGYISIDTGSGADTITIGKVLAPNGIVHLEGDTGKDIYNIQADSTAKIIIEEEGSSADTINISGAARSRFSTAARADSNLSFSMKTARDDGKTVYCLTVRGVAKNEGAGGSFSIMARNFKGDTLNILTSKNKRIASISLEEVAANVKADGKFHNLAFAKNGTALRLAAVAGKILAGTAKKDALEGTADSDIFYGSKGNDTITGINGRDVAVYNKTNWGKDTIKATNGTMTLLFAGIKASDITQVKSGTSLVITRNSDTSQKVTVQGWNAATHNIVYANTLTEFNKYVKAASPTMAQTTAARNEVWQKAGLAAKA